MVKSLLPRMGVLYYPISQHFSLKVANGARSVVHTHTETFCTVLLTFFSSTTMTPSPGEALVSSPCDKDTAFTA